MNGERIYQARLKAGMSRVQLANAIKTSERNIQRWESGRNQPRVSSVALIAQATGHDLEFFLAADADEDEEAASMSVSRDEYLFLETLTKSLTAALKQRVSK